MRRTLVLLFGVMALAGWARADGLPAYYPESFEVVGRVDLVDYRENRVVVNDQSFHLANDVQIATRFKASDTMFSIRPGVKVGLDYTREARRRVVHNVWVLPADYGVSFE